MGKPQIEKESTEIKPGRAFQTVSSTVLTGNAERGKVRIEAKSGI
jgi:hypothetical protein